MATEVWGRKNRVTVDLVDNDGLVRRGSVYCGLNELPVHASNDGRPFLLFEPDESGFELINKSTIAMIRPAGDGQRIAGPSFQVMVQVELHKMDGEVLEGKLGILSGRRFSDLVNGDMTFLPLVADENGFLLINKSVIARIVPVAEEEPYSPYIPT